MRKSCQFFLIIEQRKCNVKQCKTDQRGRMISLVNRATARVCRALGWSTKYQLPMENWRLLLLQQHCNLEYSLAKKAEKIFKEKNSGHCFIHPLDLCSLIRVSQLPSQRDREQIFALCTARCCAIMQSCKFCTHPQFVKLQVQGYKVATLILRSFILTPVHPQNPSDGSIFWVFDVS